LFFLETGQENPQQGPERVLAAILFLTGMRAGVRGINGLHQAHFLFLFPDVHFDLGSTPSMVSRIGIEFVKHVKLLLKHKQVFVRYIFRLTFSFQAVDVGSLLESLIIEMISINKYFHAYEVS
jgi:hypothetical protein